MHKVLGDKRTIFFLVFPGIFLMFAGILFPILMSGYLSLTDMQDGSVAVFVGLKNYIKIFTSDKTFWVSIFHALILGVSLILIQHPICITFALMLDKIGGKAEKIFRILFFVPCVISVVVTSKMWINILNPTFGLMNKLLALLGLESFQRNWLSDPKTVLGCVMFIIMWQGFGYGMLIYYAGIKGISNDVVEACKIDGAIGIKKFFYVTFPMLLPVVKVSVTLAMISALKQMESVYLITDGGPGDKSQFIANYLYQQAFRGFKYGYANAISVVFVIICLVATGLYNKFIKVEDI
ncbi:MAG TPA: sugar ABC transporter permease [Ruminiclostridium sp.]